MAIPHVGVLNNHVLTVDDSGRLVTITPIVHELAYTIYVPHPIAVIAASDENRFRQLFMGSNDIHQLYTKIDKESLMAIKQEDKICIFELLFNDSFLKQLL